MLIRIAEPNDAAQLVNLIQQVENSNFMLFEPGERTLSVEQQKKRIESMKEEKSSTILIAEDNGIVVGYLVVIGGNPNRAKHSVYLVIGIEENYRGKGIGAKLFTKLDEWARDQYIHRLELTVMVHNKAATALYEKMGFEIEGTKRHSLFIDGKYIDEYYMSKLI
ncbi:GNAT family N-acetyltransferase [Sporosarcina limicola]|uniref:RimJ/RimL family protein N-acetyltransferase n=1 Tax=Sporosarcina limicola TaxID=34101 RepID=A0A927MLI4_9BACL|nr:GNAT family N-acetyltransferase [Sporosarcina limicola]MBE1556808.1 RimJ/RimL family protein N-acetyltransferase [Sporosarcina limicola]